MRGFRSAGFVLWVLAATAPAVVSAADLPIREVVLYKHGVAFFERSGTLDRGETARLDFKAEDMNDVLKSLILTDRKGGKVGGVRYDASEPLEERLKDFPFELGSNFPLAAFLDQLKGSRIELTLAAETAAGVIVGARMMKSTEKDRAAERETVTLLTDAAELRTLDLAAASAVKLSDPKLQALLKDYLAALSQARSKDRRSVYIDAPGAGARELVARYLTPAPVWKSSYRLLFAPQGEPTLEGWAIVDNMSGDDWNSVRLSVVSGRPISFVTQLYEPKYVERPEAELADNRAAAPRVFAGAMEAAKPPPAPAPVARLRALKKKAGPGQGGADEEDEDRPALASALGSGAMAARAYSPSSVAATAEGREAGALFEYDFAAPVTVKKGQSAMLPFLQQKLAGRRLLIYSESFGLNPQNAAELTNSSGKTLDGGPITVYDAGTYAGEALMETVKAGDKRLISYGVDLGTRIATAWGSSKTVVREIHLRRGILTSRVATEETKNYSIKNVDEKPKTLIIEHPHRQAYKLLDPQKPAETTASAYRFEVKVGASASEAFAVREERVDDQTVAVTGMAPNVLATWVQNKALGADAQRQLEAIAQKKREIAANESALGHADAGLTGLTQDQDRIRRNIDSLRNVAGQGELVQQYARQLAANEVKIAGLRDTQSDLRRKKAALEAEVNALIEKTEF